MALAVALVAWLMDLVACLLVALVAYLLADLVAASSVAESSLDLDHQAAFGLSFAGT
jgi:hypothetical protein